MDIHIFRIDDHDQLQPAKLRVAEWAHGRHTFQLDLLDGRTPRIVTLKQEGTMIVQGLGEVFDGEADMYETSTNLRVICPLRSRHHVARHIVFGTRPPRTDWPFRPQPPEV